MNAPYFKNKKVHAQHLTIYVICKKKRYILIE